MLLSRRCNTSALIQHGGRADVFNLCAALPLPVALHKPGRSFSREAALSAGGGEQNVGAKHVKHLFGVQCGNKTLTPSLKKTTTFFLSVCVEKMRAFVRTEPRDESEKIQALELWPRRWIFSRSKKDVLFFLMIFF